MLNEGPLLGDFDVVVEGTALGNSDGDVEDSKVETEVGALVGFKLG